MTTKIQWTDETWLMWPGCVPASAGCKNCYAVRDGWRLSFNPNDKVSAPYAGIVKKVLADGTEILGGEDHPRRREPGTLKFTGLTRFLPERLAEPLRWRKPRRIFVSANSDLFLPERVATEAGRRQIAAVFGVMAATPRHTYQVLTKHPDKALEWFAWADDAGKRSMWNTARACGFVALTVKPGMGFRSDELRTWPLPNVWIGTSVEDQAAADRRIPDLLRVPAALRFLSCEPLLGYIELDRPVPANHAAEPGRAPKWDWAGPLTGQGWDAQGDQFGPFGDFVSIDWVIIGGESGPNARPCEVPWIRSIVYQCKAARVSCFVKQLGAKPLARSEDDLGPEAFMSYDAMCGSGPFPRGGWIPRLNSRAGSDPDEWPEDLRVREMPGQGDP